jgi:hypothetical protein
MGQVLGDTSNPKSRIANWHHTNALVSSLINVDASLDRNVVEQSSDKNATQRGWCFLPA